MVVTSATTGLPARVTSISIGSPGGTVWSAVRMLSVVVTVVSPHPDDAVSDP